METNRQNPAGKGPGASGAERRAGIVAALGCYILWGVFPLYWKLLSGVDSIEIICQRIIWCCVFTVCVCAIARYDFVSLLKSSRARAYLIPASILITVNWSVYIFAVQIDRIVETAIGYYLNPLVSMALGIMVFKERLTPIQVVAIALCCVGILAFTMGYGEFPWISIVLALSFGAYGAVKKKGGYPAVEALAFENTVVVVPAIAVSFLLAGATGQHGFLGDVLSFDGWKVTALLVLGGVVTAVPLILFARAANLIPLTLLGFFQFLSPTIAMMIGVFLNGEPFTLSHMVCVGCIWGGLALVLADGVLQGRRGQG